MDRPKKEGNRMLEEIAYALEAWHLTFIYERANQKLYSLK
jgi:hypothetical protein